MIIDNNISNIKLENVAVGDELKNIEVSLFGQSSSTVDFNDKNSKTIKVKQITIDKYVDDFNLEPDFIKIDVDGYELNVLRGMLMTIRKYKPIIVIETNDNVDVLNLLKREGYNLYDLDLRMVKDDEVPNNVFCF